MTLLYAKVSREKHNWFPRNLGNSMGSCLKTKTEKTLFKDSTANYRRFKINK